MNVAKTVKAVSRGVHSEQDGQTPLRLHPLSPTIVATVSTALTVNVYHRPCPAVLRNAALRGLADYSQLGEL